MTCIIISCVCVLQWVEIGIIYTGLLLSSLNRDITITPSIRDFMHTNNTVAQTLKRLLRMPKNSLTRRNQVSDINY